MKTLLFKMSMLLVCAIFYSEVIAQNDSLRIDSLKKVLLNQKEDTNKVNTLNELANSFSPQETNSIFNYAIKALSLSRKLNYLKGEAESYLLLGRNDLFAGNAVSAFQYVKKAIEIFRKSGNDEKLLDALNLYSILMSPQKNFREQLNILLEAEKIGLRLHDSDRLHMIASNIAGTYKEFGKNDSSETYYKRAYELSTKIKNDAGRVNSLSSLGLLYLDEGRYKEAEAKFQQCLFFLHLDNTATWIGSVYFGIGKLFLKKNNLDSALYYANKSFEIENSKPDSIYLISDPAQLLSELYEKKNNYKAALHFYKLATSAKDSVYNGENAQQLASLLLREKEKEQEIIAAKKDFENKLQLYISLGVILIVLIVALLFYRNNKKQKDAKIKIEKAYSELKSTQSQLIQSEKMASLGELTAGIAHEIQNPLNFVNNFSEVNKELISELLDEVDKKNYVEVTVIANDIKDNSEKINFHGKRAGDIVKGMLQHSRKSSGAKEPTDINALTDEYLRLSYHGLRAKDKNFNADFKTDFDSTIGKINIIPQDMGRVILNLINNAFYAVTEKKKLNIDGYKPTISVQTKKINDKIEIIVSDNGNGIPSSIKEKIFQPFFTTKPTGQGTGLGLSLSYDIIKAHGGEIKVNTKEGEGSEFIIKLPVV
jgi:signal transduction histidine kinase